MIYLDYFIISLGTILICFSLNYTFEFWAVVSLPDPFVLVTLVQFLPIYCFSVYWIF